MTDSLKAISAEIEAYADDVFSGKKTLLKIERHLLRKGFTQESVCNTMKLIRDAISRRKKVCCCTGHKAVRAFRGHQFYG